MFRSILNKSFVDAKNTEGKLDIFQNVQNKIQNTYPWISSYNRAFDFFKNPYCILALLALSKTINSRIRIEYRNTPFEGTSADTIFRNWEEDQKTQAINTVGRTIRIAKVRMASSTFHKNSMRNTFIEFGYHIPELLNKSIEGITDGKIRGIAINKQNSIIIVMDKTYATWRFDPYLELFTLSIIFSAFQELIQYSAPSTPLFFEAFHNIISAIPTTEWDFDHSDNETMVRVGETFRQIVTDWVKEQPEFQRNDANELVEFIQSLNATEKSHAESRLQTTLASMERAKQELERSISNYRDACEKLTFLNEHKIKDTEKRVTKFIEFLKLTTAIKDYQLYDQSILFLVEQPLYLNEDAGWDVLKTNIQNEDTKELLEHIFIINDYKLWTSAAIKLNITGPNVNSTSELGIVPDTIPHPHIMQYNCFGTHVNLILDRLKENDLIGCTEQIIEAVSSLNWSDAPVMRHFYQVMATNQSKCIEHNGKRITIQEAIDEINA